MFERFLSKQRFLTIYCRNNKRYINIYICMYMYIYIYIYMNIYI